MKKKLVVYTAIDGGHYVLKPQDFSSESVDFVCFTNKKVKASPWKIRKLENKYENKRLNYKWYKCMAHKLFKEYEYSLWIDSMFVLRSDPSPYIDKYLQDSNIAMFRHHAGRKCLYEEGEVCVKLNLANKNIVDRQLERYKKDGYPEKNGLNMTGVILRRHDEDDVRKTMKHWFREIESGCKRDQVSFNYCVWKNKLKLNIFEENHKNNHPVFGVR